MSPQLQSLILPPVLPRTTQAQAQRISNMHSGSAFSSSTNSSSSLSGILKTTHSSSLASSSTLSSGSASSSDTPPTPKHARFKLPESKSSSSLSSLSLTPSPTHTVTPDTYFPTTHRVSPQTQSMVHMSPIEPSLDIFDQELADLEYDENEAQPSSSSHPVYNVADHPYRYSATHNPSSAAFAHGPGSVEYEMWKARLEHNFKKRPNREVLSDDEEDERNSTGRSRRPFVPRRPAGQLGSAQSPKRNVEKEEYVFGGRKERREQITVDDPRHAEYMRDSVAALDRGFAEADEAARAAKAKRSYFLPTTLRRSTSEIEPPGHSIDTSSSTLLGPSSLSRRESRLSTRSRSCSTGLRSLLASRSTSVRLGSDHTDTLTDYGEEHNFSNVEDTHSDEGDSRRRRTISTLSFGLSHSRSRSRRRRDSDTDSFIVNSVMNVSRSRSHGVYLQSGHSSTFPVYHPLQSSRSVGTASSYRRHYSRSRPRQRYGFEVEAEEEPDYRPLTRRTRKEEIYHVWVGFEQGWIFRMHRFKTRVRDLGSRGRKSESGESPDRL